MIFLFSFFLLPSAFATDVPSCNPRLWGYIIYEDKVDGVIVQKKSVFTPMDWSPSSEFDGLVVKHDDPSETLVLLIKKNPSSGVLKSEEKHFTPWILDSNYKKAEVIPKDVLEGHQGAYTLQLKKGTEVLCESTYSVFGGD